MKISEVEVKDMNPIDGSSVRRYSVIINQKRIMYQTSGAPFSLHPHITKEEFKRMAIEAYKEENFD